MRPFLIACAVYLVCAALLLLFLALPAYLWGWWPPRVGRDIEAGVYFAFTLCTLAILVLTPRD